ncbi:MAG: hypothetical protein QM753_07805 [Thermomicrobiales bacterium]
MVATGSADGTIGQPVQQREGWMMSRRMVVKAIGGGVLVVAALGAGGVAIRAGQQGVFSTGEGPAYGAWQVWDGGAGDVPPMAMVRAAILAANGHNIQPWRFTVSDDHIVLEVDSARTTGALDPLLRERDISIGAATENLVLAAAAHGFAATATVTVVDGAPRIDVALAEGGSAPSRFDAVPHRPTDRAAFDTSRPVTQASLDALAALNEDADVRMIWLSDANAMAAFSDLTIAATKAIIADSEQSEDSFAWWRGDGPTIDAHKDGITIDTSGIPAWKRAAAKILPGQSRSAFDAAWLDSTRNTHLSTAAAFGIVMARDLASIPQRVAVGRLYQRMHLAAVEGGMAMQPLNQVVERRDREEQAGFAPTIGDRLAALTGDTQWQAMMPFRIGYPTGVVLPSPRRPAEDVVRVDA